MHLELGRHFGVGSVRVACGMSGRGEKSIEKDAKSCDTMLEDSDAFRLVTP